MKVTIEAITRMGGPDFGWFFDPLSDFT